MPKDRQPEHTDAAPLVDVSPAVGHVSSEVVDAHADDTAAVLDGPASGGRGDAGLPGVDVAAASGAYPADVRTGNDQQTPTLPD